MNPLHLSLAVLLTTAAIYLASRGQTYPRFEANGSELRMSITGRSDASAPTVIFESGAGGSLDEWFYIQSKVGRFARAISYDRAGNGLSEKGFAPRDGRRIAAELHAALQNAHVPAPYILVGHSLGGPYIRIFAGLYPADVSGMLLVDPTQEELAAWSKERNPKPPEHRFRPDDEVDCAPLTFAQAAESRMPAGIPIILITGMGPRIIPSFLPKEMRAEVQKDQETVYPAKLKFHQAWVNKTPGARLIVTENSGHGIPLEEPELIIETVRGIIRQMPSP